MFSHVSKVRIKSIKYTFCQLISTHRNFDFNTAELWFRQEAFRNFNFNTGNSVSTNIQKQKITKESLIYSISASTMHLGMNVIALLCRSLHFAVSITTAWSSMIFFTISKRHNFRLLPWSCVSGIFINKSCLLANSLFIAAFQNLGLYSQSSKRWFE